MPNWAGSGVPAAYFREPGADANRQQRALEPVIRAMGPVSLVRSSEEHAGPHRAWFWDPTQQAAA